MALLGKYSLEGSESGQAGSSIQKGGVLGKKVEFITVDAPDAKGRGKRAAEKALHRGQR